MLAVVVLGNGAKALCMLGKHSTCLQRYHVPCPYIKIKTIVSFQPGMVVWPCNFCTREDETGGLLWALGQPIITVRLCLCERERNKEKTQTCILPFSIYLLKQIQGALRKRVKKQPNVLSSYFQREQLPSYMWDPCLAWWMAEFWYWYSVLSSRYIHSITHDPKSMPFLERQEHLKSKLG